MEYRRLGKSGLKVSEFSLGSWVTFNKQVDESSAIELMAAAYDAGINFFDNAEGYEAGKSEIVMGEALKKLAWTRDSYIVSSKVFWGGSKPTQRGLSRKHIHDACHAALKRLQVDYLDLFFCHRPDLDTPIEETVSAMDVLVRQGKVLYWGTSQWTGQQITEAIVAARSNHMIAPAMEQPEYNVFAREKMENDFLPVFDLAGIGTTIWSPLASGLLTGKYNDGIPADSRFNLPGYEWLKREFESAEGKAKLAKVKELGKLAKEAGLPLNHMALLWCLSNPHVSTVILGASRLSQLQDNLKALDAKARLTSDVKQKIEDILQNKPAGPLRY
jgi:voltage-dependent potassium channel beta subunit